MTEFSAGDVVQTISGEICEVTGSLHQFNSGGYHPCRRLREPDEVSHWVEVEALTHASVVDRLGELADG